MRDIEDMSRNELIGCIMRLRSENYRLRSRLESVQTDLSWIKNPDRSGGQFTQEELNRGWGSDVW